ncbi:MAG: hypothetical protein GQ542_05050 [Desulforhopalus sp.]|jgi:hypothetical protein|nr:hypothetical protein [Desulforhopalus sp.]
MALNQSLQQVPNIYSDMVRSYQNCLAGFSRYSSDLYQSFLISTLYFDQVESKNVLSASPLESLEKTHFQLSLYIIVEVCNRTLWLALKTTMGYATFEMQRYLPALLKVS